MHVYVWLNLFAVHLKLSQHCQSAVFQYVSDLVILYIYIYIIIHILFFSILFHYSLSKEIAKEGD